MREPIRALFSRTLPMRTANEKTNDSYHHDLTSVALWHGIECWTQISATNLPTFSPVATTMPARSTNSITETRKAILRREFPRPGSGSKYLRYDEESSAYMIDEMTKEFQCPVCLEAINEQGVLLSCHHTCRWNDNFIEKQTHRIWILLLIDHYECLMGWMVRGHDECPQCRVPLWNQEVRQRMERQCSSDQTMDSRERRDAAALRRQELIKTRLILLWLFFLLMWILLFFIPQSRWV